MQGTESNRILPWNQDRRTPQRKPFYERLLRSSAGIVRLYVWIDRLESYGVAACESGLASTSRIRLIASFCILLMRLWLLPSPIRIPYATVIESLRGYTPVYPSNANAVPVHPTVEAFLTSV